MDQNLPKTVSTAMADYVSRNEWGEYLDKLNLNSGDLLEISNWLTSRAVLLAEMAEYLNRRGGAGCGDDGHDEAMKEAQKERKKIRKVLGYSYP